MTATLLLIRHAMHTDYNKRFSGRSNGVPLSVAGEAQARGLGERLANEPIAAVYASPRQRTQQTAQAIAAAQGLPVQTEQAVDELDMGAWTGAEIESLRHDRIFQRWNEHRAETCPPGGEHMVAAAERMTGFAARAATAHPNETVAVVSHADVIKAFVAACLGLSFDHVLRFEIGPASVSRLLFGDWGAKLLTLNEGAAA